MQPSFTPFDDQVRQTGEAHSLAPREWIWPRIEAELDKRKKRRVALWWWLPFVLLLGAGGGWWATSTLQQPKPAQIAKHTDDTTTQHTQPSPQQPTATPSQAEPQQSHGQPVLHPNNETTHISPAPRLAKLGLGSTQKPTVAFQPNVYEATTTHQEIGQQITDGFAQKTNTAIPTDTQASTQNPNLQAAQIFLISVERKPLTQTDAGAIASPARLNEVVTNEPTAAPPSPKDSAPAAEPVTKTQNSRDTASPAKRNKNEAPAAKWTLLMSIGAANTIASSPFSVSSNKALTERALGNNLTTGGGFSNGSTAAVAPPKPGPSFMVGLQRQVRLGKNWQWQAEASYQMAQSRQLTGRRLDTAVRYQTFTSDFFYSGGNSQTYTATLHRLQLQTSWSYRLAGQQRPLTLQMGPYLGANLYQNLLLTDATSARLIPGSSRHNRFSVGLATGLHWQGTKGFAAGLVYRADLTPAYKKLNGNATYWRSWLLQMHVPLSKKSNH